MALSDAALAHLRRLDVPPETDRYETLSELGRGGMGIVYRVRDRLLDREAALKVIADTLSGADVARLRREAQVLAQLEHPGIVPVHDVGVLADGRSYYVMKLVRGETLSTKIAAAMPRGEGLRVFVRVCDTVAYAHSRGVIHRDLTPRNIMVGEFGEVLVLDWGVAKVKGAAERSRPNDAPPSTDAVETKDGAVVGTPGYMAPEQVGRAAEADARSDVYALGRVLRDIVDGPGGQWSPPLRSIIAKATAPSPDARYGGAGELGRDVAAFLDGLTVIAHRESIPELIGRFARRHQVALGLIGVYVFVRFLLLTLFRD
jgi:serine/threonine-protein kinase